LIEQLKVALAADACGAKIVLDDEDRDALVFWDDHWAQNARLGEDHVIAFSADVREAVFLKDAFQPSPGDLG
jgi:hypothetical protein